MTGMTTAGYSEPWLLWMGSAFAYDSSDCWVHSSGTSLRPRRHRSATAASNQSFFKSAWSMTMIWSWGDSLGRLAGRQLSGAKLMRCPGNDHLWTGERSGRKIWTVRRRNRGNVAARSRHMVGPCSVEGAAFYAGFATGPSRRSRVSSVNVMSGAPQTSARSYRPHVGLACQIPVGNSP
jgi:hypothetical protein